MKKKKTQYSTECAHNSPCICIWCVLHTLLCTTRARSVTHFANIIYGIEIIICLNLRWWCDLELLTYASSISFRIQTHNIIHMQNNRSEEQISIYGDDNDCAHLAHIRKLCNRSLCVCVCVDAWYKHANLCIIRSLYTLTTQWRCSIRFRYSIFL